MTLRATILGSGSSGGVPRVGGDWGVCDPHEPKNRRTRCSLLIEQWTGEVEPADKDKTIILVDTSPDLREQLLASRIPVYMDDTTKDGLLTRFGYCFEMPEGRIHPPIFDLQNTFKSKDKLQINGPGGPVKVTALGLSHGVAPSFGFKFNGALVYTPDVLDIEDDVLDLIKGAKTWVCDALKYNRSPAHVNVDKTLMWQAYTQVPKTKRKSLYINKYIYTYYFYSGIISHNIHYAINSFVQTSPSRRHSISVAKARVYIV